MSERTEGLWQKLMEGEPPVDEATPITSSDVNRAGADKASQLWGGAK